MCSQSMRRWCTLLLVPLLLVFFAACAGSGADTPPADATEEPTTQAPTEAPAEPTEEPAEEAPAETPADGEEPEATAEPEEEPAGEEGVDATQQPQEEPAADLPGEVVAAGLNGPLGLLVDGDTIWAIDSGLGGEENIPFNNPQTLEPITATYGMSARIVRIGDGGTMTDVVSLPSVATGMDFLGGAGLARLDGELYATLGQWLGDPESERLDAMASVVRVGDGEFTEVANLWAVEAEQNPDGTIFDSHPYGITAGPDGSLLVADAAANALLRVHPASGDVEVVAVFEPLSSPIPNPNYDGEQLTDAVPTGVVTGEEGAIYVSFLSGFPFVPGSAKVMQVSSEGEVSEYATNLTTLVDLRMGPDGALYAVQFAEFSDQGPAPNSGAIVRIGEGDASEVLMGGLPFPTAIDFDEEGNAYVTINGVGPPESGQVIRIDGLTGM